MKRFIPVLLLALFCSTAFSYEIPTFVGDELIVTAARYLQPKKNVIANVKVISASDIKVSGAENAAEALKKFSSVSIKSNGGRGGISTMKFRSANSQQILIMVDGNRINSTLLGMYDIADIPADNIARIEIVDESISSLYGSDAIGGAVNIITKKGSGKPYDVNVSVGSFGSFGYRLALDKNLSGCDVYGLYSSKRTDGFRVNSDYKISDYAFNISCPEGVDVKFNGLNSERGNPGVPSSSLDASSASTPFDRQSDNAKNLVISYANMYSAASELTGHISLNTSDQGVHCADSFVPGTFSDDRYFSSIYGLNIQNVSEVSKYHALTTGVEIKRSLGESSKAGNRIFDNSSFYVNSEIGSGLPVSAYFGARLDSNSVWGSTVNPRVGLLFKPDSGTAFRLSMATAFRSPTFNELYWNEPSWGMFGNTALKPETSNSLNFSLEKEVCASQLKVAYFRNDIKDMIKWSQTSAFVWQTVNIGKVVIEGAGIEIKKQFSEALSVFVNCDIENASDTGSGRFLTYSPAQKGNAGITYSSEGVEAMLSARAVSSVFTDSANAKTIAGYSVADISLAKDCDTYQMMLKVDNAFNQNYIESVGASQVDGQERGYPMPGRTISIGFRI